ncbi:SLC13 family permease [Kribbella sindirgiensis]|uniref:SLC13 family permease n=1 Tax=Kribbella sindirgiensis TaxID=1124744 RepID=UPI001EDE32A6
MFLIAEVMASNIGGAATLIGDPPNIIIASRSGLTFNDFLLHLTPLVAIELLVFVGFIGHSAFHIEPSIVALLGAGVLVLVSKVPTLPFFAGHTLLTAMLILVVSALLSGVIDNIPYVATMSPVVLELTKGVADFGGNATAIGASANVVVIGLALRAGHPISFWAFTRKGVVMTAITILVAAPYLWLRYFAFS